jgi:signal transduction histidine kinase
MANVALAESDVEGWKYYSKKFEQADAALTNDKIQKNLLELEAKYKLSKKESELLQKEADNRKRLWVIAALTFGMLSLATIAFLQFRNNKNKLKIEKQDAIIEKQNALAEERLRIAADMHDDVGAGLSRIRYISAGLKNQPGIKQEDIDRIVSLSDESVEKMNEIIWALNQGNQQLEEILYFTRSQCSEMISNAGLEFSFSIPDKIPLITIAWKDCRNIYLLVKEAVNNAIKHASAKKISIHIEFNDGLLIQVSDDGIGFSEAALQRQGNGLLNYKKRIESLKGKYALTSSDGNGTALSFEVPLAGLIP